nr:MAG TPA: hypothetical protein [Caudoviricetes sp.]
MSAMFIQSSFFKDSKSHAVFVHPKVSVWLVIYISLKHCSPVYRL